LTWNIQIDKKAQGKIRAFTSLPGAQCFEMGNAPNLNVQDAMETVEKPVSERLMENVQMQGFRIPRNKAYREVRRSDLPC
jgi:hypothetical protein